MPKVKNTAEMKAVLSDTLDNVLNDKISTVKTKNIVAVINQYNRANTNDLKYKHITQNGEPLEFFESK
jgi:hypothetical protein